MAFVDDLRERIGEHAVELCMRAADLTVTATQAAASRRTGELAEGITHTQPVLAGNYVICEIVSAAFYSRWEDEGTGIYGPSGMRIFPTNAKVLRFDSPAAGGIVYAKSVAGSPGKHFFTEPMPERWASALQSAGGG